MRLFLLVLLILNPIFGQEKDPKLEDDLQEGIDLQDEIGDPAVAAWSKATDRFDKAKEKLREQYRKDLSKAVAQGAVVEIFLLDFEMVGELPENGELLPTNSGENADQVDWSHRYFQIQPYGGFSKVLKRRRLKGAVLKKCQEAIMDQLLRPDHDSSAFCHHPIHGIRVSSQEGVSIFQSSFCHICGNYFLIYPDDFQTAHWVDFSSKKLEEFLMKEMPIPQTELDRFNAKYGREKKE